MKLCSFDGCDKPMLCKEVCNGHYLQRFRGEELRPLRRPRYSCAFPECDRPHSAKGFCSRHYQQTLDGNKPSPIKDYRADSVSYGALHTRIRSQKGSASGYPCVKCDQPAAQWAYDHSCPFEKKSKVGPYSTDMDRYRPMCYSCHRKFDIHVGQVPA